MTESDTPAATSTATTAAPTDGPAALADERGVEVVSASVPADWIRTGRPTTVRATVRNHGGSRPFDIAVAHDGTAPSTYTVLVGDGETASFDLQVVFDEPGTGVVTVAGVEAGELTVAPATAPSPTPARATDADGGTGALATILAALAGALLAGRRR